MHAVQYHELGYRKILEREAVQSSILKSARCCSASNLRNESNQLVDSETGKYVGLTTPWTGAGEVWSV